MYDRVPIIHPQEGTECESIRSMVMSATTFHTNQTNFIQIEINEHLDFDRRGQFKRLREG